MIGVMMGAGSTAASKTHLWFGVLGPLRAERAESAVDLGGPKQRAVLAMLVAGRGRAVSRDTIIEGVWGEAGSEANRRSFHTYVSNLRAVLGDVIVRTGDTYRLEIDAGSVDSLAFESAVDEARRLLATDPGLVAVSLREALGLWRGRPYADLTDVPGLEPEVRRLEELRLEAVELRIDAELASGLHGSLVAEVEALAEEHPMRERFRAQHMLALYRSGRQSEALRAYRRTESFLAEELGVEPSDELRDLELKILQHDESLLGGTGRAVTQRLAILATDIEGSTRLWDRHPQEMAEVLATHDRLLREAMEGHGGRIFRHTGHGVLAAFPTAVAAVGAAEQAFVSLAAADWGVVGELRVRVGIDAGEVEARGGEFFGPPLNRAARLCSSGHGGQVLISEAAQTEVVSSARPGVQFRQLGEYRLRGAAAPERIAQLVFAGFPDDFPELRVEADSALRDHVELVSLPGYEVRERLGEGAFGVVWKAYQPSVGREVAVKMIRPELASQPSFVRRFEAEARTIARLGHPHIVPLIDFWRDPDSAYLVMAQMAGGSLAETMSSGPMDSATARRILAQVGSALDHAHSQGIVHGDLRPGNVLLDGVGNAYLSDFWITSRLLNPTAASSSSTADYRAPEVEAAGPSPEADLFAFAVLAGELVDGSSGLDTVLGRGTAMSPGDRYKSAAELLADVDRVLGEPLEIELEVVSRNPYKGLRAFDVGDAADFHGRDELVAALLAAVSEHRWVTVVGPSGSGKSSVVQAGLLPALVGGMVDGSESLVHTVLTPGAGPVDALAEALEAISVEAVDVDRLVEVGLGGVVDGEVLLVVDQFEELYTLAGSDQRHRFLDLVVDAVEDPQSRVRVVATLRADFYDRPLEDFRLGRLVRDGLVTVLSPSGEELVEMITAPAHTVGLGFEPGLAYQIAEDVAHEPGGLPLLQYALTELVDHRSSNLLTTGDYARVGGVKAALATRAEALFGDLTPDQQRLTRQILLRLVTVGEDTDDTRRRVRRTELESLGLSRADLDTVLDTLVSQRLLITDRDPATRGPTVEIAHEALLRDWPRLTGWIDDQRDALILGRRFRSALTDWETNGRHDDYLLTGSRLAPYVGWAETTALTPEESHYYQESRTKDQAERTALRRRRRTLTTVLAAATVVASVFGGIAAIQADQATSEARRARASALSAFATAALPTDPALAKALAVASALTSDPSLDTTTLLRRVWAADRVTDRYVWPGDREVGFMFADLSPDGTRVVAAGCSCDHPSNYMEVYDLVSRDVLWHFEVDDPRIFIDSPVFSPDGETVVAGLFWLDEEKWGDAEAGPLGVHIFDSSTGELLRHLESRRCGSSVWAVSATHLVVDRIPEELEGCDWVYNPTLSIIDLQSGEERLLSNRGWGASFSGDGRYVAFGEALDRPMVVVADAFTGETAFRVDGRYHHRGIALNEDGSLLTLQPLPFQGLEVWDVRTGAQVGTFDGHTSEVWSARFSPSIGDTVYSTSQAGGMLHWDARSALVIAEFPAVGNGNVAVSRTGSILVTDQTARVASLIDPSPSAEIWMVETNSCSDRVQQRFVNSNSIGVADYLFTFEELCNEISGRVRNTVAVNLVERLVRSLPGGTGDASRVSPDGSHVARPEIGDGPVVSGEERWLGPIRIRNVDTGELVAEFERTCMFDLTLVQAGVAANRQEGCNPYPTVPFPVAPLGIWWSPDSQLVAVWNGIDEAVLVWDSDGRFVSGYQGCIEPHTRGVHLGGTTIYVYCTDSNSPRLILVDAMTGAQVGSYAIDGFGTDNVGFIGHTPDDSFLIGLRGLHGTGGGSLLWFDTRSMEVEELPRVHEGAPRSFARSPSGNLIATGSADGWVKVWDPIRRIQVDQIHVGDFDVRGLVFVDETSLGVILQSGRFSVYTLDQTELLALVRESVVRGFTETECQRYGFGEDCPGLEELRGETSSP